MATLMRIAGPRRSPCEPKSILEKFAEREGRRSDQALIFNTAEEQWSVSAALEADTLRVLCSVAIVIRLERASLRHTDVLRLLVRQLGQLHADLFEMQPR